MSLTIQNGNATPESRAQLEEYKERAKVLRVKLQAAHEKVSKLRLNAGEGGVSYREAAEAANERDQLAMEMNDLESGRQTLLRHVAPGGNSGGAAHDFDPTGVMAEQFQDPGFAEMTNRLAGTSAQIRDVEVGHIPRESLVRMAGGSLQAATGGVVTPTGGMQEGPFGPIVPMVQPPTTFLDLLPAGVTDQPSIPYAQEIPVTGDPGPAPAAPGSMKPAAGIAYQDAIATPTTIAGWTKVNKQALADQGQLSPAIQFRLMFKLRQAIEREVIGGTGAVSDVTGQAGLTGILQTTGILLLTATAGDPVPDTLINAITNSLMVGASANVIVMNPVDRATLLKTKSSGSGEYIANPFLAAAAQIWNVAFVPSVAMAAGKVLVADTRILATLLFREGAHVIIGQESDDMLKNRVTLLAECRASLPVWVPAAAVEVTL